jgi:hypothetical protein
VCVKRLSSCVYLSFPSLVGALPTAEVDVSHPSRFKFLFLSSARAASRIASAYPRTYSLYSAFKKRVLSSSTSSRRVSTVPIRENFPSDALRSLRPNSIHSPTAQRSSFSADRMESVRLVGSSSDSFTTFSPTAKKTNEFKLDATLTEGSQPGKSAKADFLAAHSCMGPRQHYSG